LDITKELEIIFDLRSMLIELYPETSELEKYLIANELLTELEKIVRNRKIVNT
jgi:hypothetical protein